MNLEIKNIEEQVNLNSALTKNYVCSKCEKDAIIHFSKNDVYAIMERMPTKKHNLEIAFWAKCPTCNRAILIYRTE